MSLRGIKGRRFRDFDLYSIAAFSVAEGVSEHSVVKISTKNPEAPAK